MNIERKSYLFILLASLLWAMDLIVRYPITLKLSYMQIVFVESLIGIILVTPWLITHRSELLAKLNLKDIGLFVFLGGFGMTLAGYFSTISIHEDTPGTFSFFQLLGPFIVIWGAKVFLKERISRTYFYWGACFLVSAMMIFSQDLFLIFSNNEFNHRSYLSGLGAVLIWGGCTIAAKKLLQTYSVMTLVSMRWIFAFFFALGFILFSKEGLPYHVLTDLKMMERFGLMSIVAGILGMFLYYSGLKNLRAGKVSFLELSFPAFGMILSSFYTFEELTFLQIIGAIAFFGFIGFIFFKKNHPVVQVRSMS